MPFYRNGANSETTAAIKFIPHGLNNVGNGHAPIENGWAYSTVADFMGQWLWTTKNGQLYDFLHKLAYVRINICVWFFYHVLTLL